MTLPHSQLPPNSTPARVRRQLAAEIGSGIVNLPALVHQPEFPKLQKKVQQQRKKTTRNTDIINTSAQARAKHRAVANSRSLRTTALQAQLLANELQARQLQEADDNVDQSLPSTTNEDADIDENVDENIDENFSHPSR